MNKLSVIVFIIVFLTGCNSSNKSNEEPPIGEHGINRIIQQNEFFNDCLSM